MNGLYDSDNEKLYEWGYNSEMFNCLRWGQGYLGLMNYDSAAYDDFIFIPKH